jgi:tryptophan synthase alpha chain
VSARIGEAFRRASAGNRAAFVAYLTAGDPDPETTVELARAAAAGGADVLELGVPFSDPIADGATLQRAAARALAAGTTVDRVFSAGARIRQTTNLPLVLFSYANPLLARGPNAFREAKDAGFDAVLLTDVPVEEADAFLPSIREADLDSIFLVSPTSTVSRMREAADRSRGFLYVVSRNGTTGEKTKLAADLGATVRRARRALSAQDAGSARRLPIAVGFGIATPEDAAAVAAIADGVVVGSALVACAERGGRHAARDLERLVRTLAGACAR